MTVAYTHVGNVSGATTTSLSVVTTAAAGDAFWVGIAASDTQDTERQDNTVTWNTSENFTEAVAANWNGGNLSVRWFYLLNPTATTASVQCTWGDTMSQAWLWVVKTTGHHLASPVGNSDTDGGAKLNQTITLTPATTGSLLLSIRTITANASMGCSAPHLEEWETLVGFSNKANGGYQAVTSTDAVNVTHTASSSSNSLMAGVAVSAQTTINGDLSGAQRFNKDPFALMRRP